MSKLLLYPTFVLLFLAKPDSTGEIELFLFSLQGLEDTYLSRVYLGLLTRRHGSEFPLNLLLLFIDHLIQTAGTHLLIEVHNFVVEIVGETEVLLYQQGLEEGRLEHSQIRFILSEGAIEERLNDLKEVGALKLIGY